MRSFAAAVVLFISAAIAQSTNNAISGTPDITAGQETTVEWTNPTSGTVTLWVQPAGDGSNIQASDGFVVASSVDAQSGTASFTVPADQVAPGVDYTIRIVDDDNDTIYNFSDTFTVAGASGSASGISSASDASETGTASRTGTSSSSETDSDSSTTTDESSSTTTESETTSTTSTSRSTRTTASETSAETAAPNSDNGVGSLKVQGGMVAAVAAAVALL